MLNASLRFSVQDLGGSASGTLRRGAFVFTDNVVVCAPWSSVGTSYRTIRLSYDTIRRVFFMNHEHELVIARLHRQSR